MHDLDIPAWLGRMAYERHLDAVRTYTTLGWPVCTAAYVSGGACSCERASCPAPGAHPVSAPTTREATVAALLRRHPTANLMVATGHVVDAVQVSVPRGRLALARARTAAGTPDAPAGTGIRRIGPVAVTGGTYVFFVAAGRPLLTPGVRW